MDAEIEDLRLRLDRRNSLLDLIRKAYHRDVLVIREFLLHLDNGVLISKIKSEDLGLRSIPSIDLRNQGFHLFSPQECELSLKPCFKCGGRYELIHRESSRFVSLMESSNKLKAREKELDEKLDVTLQLVEEGKQAKLKLECESLEEQNRLCNDIDRLERRRSELTCLCEQQQNKIQALEIIRQKKEILDKTFARTTAVLVESRNTNKQVEGENAVCNKHNLNLEKRCEDGLRREETLNNRLTQMSSANQELVCNVSTLEELENQLKNELDCSRSEMRRQDGIIRSTKQQLDSLEKKLAHTIDERNTTVENFDAKLASANTLIKDLRAELLKEMKEAEAFRKDTKLNLEMREQKEAEKSTNDQRRNDDLSKRVDDLTHLTLSHIQGLYDQCLEQELILTAEGALPKMRVTRMLSSSEQRTPIKSIEEKIWKKIDSTHVNWILELEDEIERRKVFGNLNNRVLMNLGHIESLIKRLHAKHSNEICNHAKKLDGIRTTYDERIILLEDKGEEQDRRFTEVSKELDTTKKRLETAESEILILTRERDDCNETIQGIQTKLEGTCDTLVSTRSHLEKTENESEITNQILESLRLDLSDREETLVQLEGFLQKSAERFAKRVEEERARLDTNINISIQAEPETKNFQQQVHFVKSGSRSIRSLEPLTSRRFFDFDDDGSIN